MPATLFAVVVALACWQSFSDPPPIDFVSFWNAARLVLQGDAASVYQVLPSRFGDLVPLAYPPPFLFIIAPFGMTGFGPSFLLWTVITGSVYLLSVRAPKRFAFACPPAASNGLIGQNGFLTAGIFLFGLQLLTVRPIIAGAILGLMVIKPQLALLLPIALIANRQWTALLGAAGTAATLLALAALVFGLHVYREFLEMLSHYSMLLSGGRWPWNEVASTFAFARWFGATQAMAMVIHAGVGISAAMAVWLAWRNNVDSKIPLLAAATLLISPYLFSYDAVLLASPLAWLAERKPIAAVLIWCLSLLPLLRIFGYAGPNGIPAAAAIAVGVMLIGHLRRGPSSD